MIRPVYSAIVRHAGKLKPKPVLVFVPSRRQARSTAVDMLTLALADRQENRFLHINPEEESFKTILSQVSDQSLRETLSRGVGFIHEGTCSQDVEYVEQLFKYGAIQVIF